MSDSHSDTAADGGSGTDSGAGPTDTAFAPLRVGQFRTLWTASVFSNLGTFFQITAGSWLMWELTASPAWVGWMTASRNIPLLFLAIPAGVLADRFDRPRMLAITQVLMGLTAGTMAVLAWAGRLGPGALLALGLALGVGIAFHAPAWQSLVPDLVPRSMVTSAVALNSVSANVARAVGPALGGIVVATAGAALAFGLNAFSYVFMIVAIVLVGRGITSGTHDGTSARRAMITGLRYAAHTPSLRRLLLVGAIFALSTAVLQAMLPVRTEELGQDAGAYGLLLGLMGAGAALGAMALGRLNRRLLSRTIPTSIILTGTAGILVGLAPNLLAAAAGMFTVGIFWVSTLANLNSTIQLMSPDWVRGRAVSLWLLAHAGMVPVGAILSGQIAERIGAGPTMVLLSAVAVGLGVTMRLRGMPDPTSIDAPEFTERRGHDHAEADGGPVMVVNTWHIRDEQLPEFLGVMAQVRAVRLSTGGSRWQMYKRAGRPYTYTETFVAATWSEHLHQHERIDDAMASIFARARRLDHSPGGPVSRHYLGFDITDEDLSSWDGIGTGHQALHATDGSVPLARIRWPLRSAKRGGS